MGNITKIKYKLSALREEKNKTFRGDYVLNRNLCIRYNELVGQLKLMINSKRRIAQMILIGKQ